MDLKTRDFRAAVLKALASSVVSIPLTSFFMDYYAALTVSIDPNNIVGTMTNGAIINTGLLIAASVFLTNYFDLEFENSRKPLT